MNFKTDSLHPCFLTTFVFLFDSASIQDSRMCQKPLSSFREYQACLCKYFMSNPCVREDSSITHTISVKLLQCVNMPAVTGHV